LSNEHRAQNFNAGKIQLDGRVGVVGVRDNPASI